MARSALHADRAAVLREALNSSEHLVEDVSKVLTSYSNHLDELVDSVDTVATTAQVRPRLPLRGVPSCKRGNQHAPVCHDPASFTSRLFKPDLRQEIARVYRLHSC